MYTNSKGQSIDPQDMNALYLARALAKAEATGDDNNITALKAELERRNGDITSNVGTQAQ